MAFLLLLPQLFINDAAGCQVPIPAWCRMVNVNAGQPWRHGGNCTFCSVETLGRYWGYQQLMGVSNTHRGVAMLPELIGLLDGCHVPHRVSVDKDLNFLLVNVRDKKLGAVVCGAGHALVLLHIEYTSVKDRQWHGRAVVIDNMDRDPRPRELTLRRFMDLWDGTAIVLIPPTKGYHGKGN